MRLLNVIVCGSPTAKKIALIKALSDHVFHSPEQVAISKNGESYSIEFGRTQVDRETFLYLASIPMGRQFDFVWERLADNLLGFLVVCDVKSKDHLAETRELIIRLKKLTDVPFVVLLDGPADMNDPGLPGFKKDLEIGRDERILCGDPASKATAKAAIVQLLKLGAKVAKKVSV